MGKRKKAGGYVTAEQLIRGRSRRRGAQRKYSRAEIKMMSDSLTQNLAAYRDVIPQLQRTIKQSFAATDAQKLATGARAALAACAAISKSALSQITQTEELLTNQLKPVVAASAALNASFRQSLEQLRDVARAMVESPRFKTIIKMEESRGVLHALPEERNVVFVPSAILEYGFAHLPTKSDPEGKLFGQLPKTPDPFDVQSGAYLFFPKESQSLKSSTDFWRDPLYLEAVHVFEEHKPRGVEPIEVLRALLMDTGIEHCWLDIDPAVDIDAQVSEFKKWLARIPRKLFGRKGAKRHRARDAALQTLVFTLWQSARLSAREIAKRVYPREYQDLHRDAHESKFIRGAGDPLEARVRQICRQVRQALKGINIIIPGRRKP